MSVAEKVPVVLQVLWIIISIPLIVILIVYGVRAADFGFPVMGTPAPAAYMFSMLGLVAIVILISLLLRFEFVCCSRRGVGLVVVLASLVVENLAIAFYGGYGSDMAKRQVEASIAEYSETHRGDEYWRWWAEWILKNGAPAIDGYVQDRTVTPAKLVFGFALTWFILHTVVFYLIILPRDGLPEAPLPTEGAKGYTV